MSAFAPSLALTFTALVSVRIVASDGTFLVYRGKGLPTNKLSNFVNKVVANEAICELLCAAMKTNGSICVAAQYDTSSQTCSMAVNCGILQLQANDTLVTYVPQNYFTDSPMPKIFYPLSSSACNAFDDFYSSTAVNPTFNKSTDLTTNTTANTYLTLTTTFWYPLATINAWPSTPWAMITDKSPDLPLDIFRGSFTIGFWFKAACCPYPANAPVLEFLGPNVGQMCVTVRTGCTGGCMHFYAQTTCGCSISSYKTVQLTVTAVTDWVHYAVVYNSDKNIFYNFYNGQIQLTTALDLGNTLYNISRINLGASECNSWRSYQNSNFGSIACVHLYDKALIPEEVAGAYKLCQGPLVFL